MSEDSQQTPTGQASEKTLLSSTPPVQQILQSKYITVVCQQAQKHHLTN